MKYLCECLESYLTLYFSYRLLQISSFNGKMNALNEVNKVISSVSYYTHRHGNPEEEEWLTAERMAVSPLIFFFFPQIGIYLRQKLE